MQFILTKRHITLIFTRNNPNEIIIYLIFQKAQYILLLNTNLWQFIVKSAESCGLNIPIDEVTDRRFL